MQWVTNCFLIYIALQLYQSQTLIILLLMSHCATIYLKTSVLYFIQNSNLIIALVNGSHRILRFTSANRMELTDNTLKPLRHSLVRSIYGFDSVIQSPYRSDYRSKMEKAWPIFSRFGSTFRILRTLLLVCSTLVRS